jgi:hypothetical protein
MNTARDLTSRLRGLLGRERFALAEFLVALSHFHERTLWLTDENRAEVLPRFFGLSKREAQSLVAELQPAENPPMRAVVTPIRAPAVAAVALWKRDAGTCQFRLASGEICGSTLRLEIDHDPIPAPSADHPPSRTVGSPAASTTTSRRARCSATPGWTGTRAGCADPTRRRYRP